MHAFNRANRSDRLAPARGDAPSALPSLWSLASVLSAVAVLAGCGSPSAAAPATIDARETAACPPLRIVIFQDKTGSATWMRTPQISVDDLEPLIAYIARCSGEIALGLVERNSNASLVRMHVERPAPVWVEPPVAGGSAFRRERAQRERAEKRRTFEADSAAHFDGVAQRVAAFQDLAAPLLQRPPNARRTDIWGAISRAAYFLGEPVPGGVEQRLVALLASDAKDNIGAPSVPLPERAELLLVNGEPSLGALKDLDPRRFESFASAVRFLVNER
jgi:hypothetical protein